MISKRDLSLFQVWSEKPGNHMLMTELVKLAPSVCLGNITKGLFEGYPVTNSIFSIGRIIRHPIPKWKTLIKNTECWVKMHNGKMSLNLFLRHLLVKGSRICHLKIWLEVFRTCHLKVCCFGILIFFEPQALEKQQMRREAFSELPLPA